VRLALASANPGKLDEFRALWPGVEIDPAPEGFGPRESGVTFLQNAWIKASALVDRADPQATAVADDSGLVVHALGGRPGVFSARYAGEDASDDDNCRRLLEELGDESDRRAAFVCVLVALASDRRMFVAAGCCPGMIAPAMRGERGFGYDPVFVPEGHERSMAELTREEKAAVSHRGRAARRMGSLLGIASR
jgi:XTP/dITP diphosphohydrolase